MKKVLKPKQDEECIYYSDFSGKLFKDFVPVTVTIECNYGSKYDESKLELHLSDKGLEKLLEFLKENLSQETKKELKKQIELTCKSTGERYNMDLHKQLI